MTFYLLMNHRPATDALSSLCVDQNIKDDDHRAGPKAPLHVRRIVFPVSIYLSGEAALRAKQPRSFDMRDVVEETRRIENSMHFPRIDWSFEDPKLAASIKEGKTWMHSDPTMRRQYRGIVRSNSSCDLSEMFADTLD